MFPRLRRENLVDIVSVMCSPRPSSSGWEYRVAYYQEGCQGFCYHVLRGRNGEVELDRYYNKNPELVPRDLSFVRENHNRMWKE